MATPSHALTTTDAGAIAENVIIKGDLQQLTPVERANYYGAVCKSIGLNPLTKPFEYITLNSKLTLYARKDATDQLRSLRGVSVTIVSREQVGDVYMVIARATTPDGRTDESIGAVTVGNLKGDALANALMKAETKAKRRVTLSICGLGMLDETETETIPGAHLGAVETPAPAQIAPARPCTSDQVEDLGIICDQLYHCGVADDAVITGIQRLTGVDIQSLEVVELARLNHDQIQRVIDGYGKRLADIQMKASAKAAPMDPVIPMSELKWYNPDDDHL